MSNQPDSHEQVLIYDAECRLCVTAKEGLESCGHGLPLRFVPYQSEEAVRCLGKVYKPGRPDVAFLVEPEGRIRSGLDAFLPLLPWLPGGRLLAALAHVSPFTGLARPLYRIVAKHRYRWFGTVPCPSANPDKQSPPPKGG